jgi:hypothetical protein
MAAKIGNEKYRDVLVSSDMTFVTLGVTIVVSMKIGTI